MEFGYHDPQTLCQLTYLCGDFLNKESTAIIQDTWRTSNITQRTGCCWHWPTNSFRGCRKQCEKGKCRSPKRWRTFSAFAVLTHYCYILGIFGKKAQISDLQYWVAIGYTLHNLQEVDLQLSRNGCLTVQLKYLQGTILHEKLAGPQLVHKLPAFFGKSTFITSFTRAHQLSVSWTRSIQSMTPSHFLTINFIIILPNPLRSSKGFPFLRFPCQSPVFTFPLPHTYHMLHPFHVLFLFLNNIWWGLNIIKHFSMKFSPLSCSLVPLGSKFHLQYSILEHPHPVFLLPYESPSFTSIQKTWTYISVFMFLDVILEDKRFCT